LKKILESLIFKLKRSKSEPQTVYIEWLLFKKIRTQDTFVIFLLLLELENGEPVETLGKN